MINVDKLLLNASPSLTNQIPWLSDELIDNAGILYEDLIKLLNKRNGFFAFEKALHVLPTHSNSQEIGINDWNAATLWKSAYNNSISNYLFFAEDIFGMQFCINKSKIHTFDPETGAFNFMANNLDEWAQAINDDINFLTGYPLAHAWQKENGPIPTGKRLLPKIPFVAGGNYELNNLFLIDAIEGMKYRAHIAEQIKNLPDGTSIEIEFKN